MPRDPDDGNAPPVAQIPGPRQPPAESGGGTDAGAGASRRPSKEVLELVAIVLLSVTTILTAWTAFQASKWGGAMSIAFSEASSSRIEAARADGAGNVRTSNHIGLWTQWAAAVGAGETELADFIVERFPEPLATAHQDWLAAGGTAEGAPDSPFAMSSYVLPEKVAAAAADARADGRFAAALTNNQRSDNYTILTVLFAAVLFFSAMSSRARDHRSQRALLAIGLLLGVVGMALLVTFPKLI
jgi:hypothetical protein